MTTKHRTTRYGIALAAILGTVGMAGIARADDDDHHRRSSDFYDRDGYGTLDVAPDALPYDTDRDEQLIVDSPRRMYRRPVFHDRRNARLFARLDRNDDGVLSRWEVRRSMLRRSFYRLDRNGDGVVTAWELDRSMRRGRYVAPQAQYGTGVRYGFRIGF